MLTTEPLEAAGSVVSQPEFLDSYHSCCLVVPCSRPLRLVDITFLTLLFRSFQYISNHLKSVWGEAFLQKGGKKPKGKKEKEKFKKELLEKKFKTGSASNRRRSSKKGWLVVSRVTQSPRFCNRNLYGLTSSRSDLFFERIP